MVREMTSGKPLKLILQFFLPLLLGNVFQQFYSMVDAIIVGKFIDVNAFAAVGSTGSLNFLIIGFVIGMTSGFCIPVSQSFGENQIPKMRQYIANAAYIAIAVTVVLTVLTVIFTRPMLNAINTPDDIIDNAYNYLVVILGGIPVTMLYNYLSAILRSLGDSKTPLFFLAIASVVNILLDLLFIIVFKSGVAGAGWATVISQLVAGVLCIIYMRKNYAILRFDKDELKFRKEKIIHLSKIGFPMGCQFSITAIGSIILQSAVNDLGTVVVASVTAASKLQTLVIQPMETLGITMATYCGQNLGAGKIDRVKLGMRKCLLLSIGYSIIAGVVMWFFGGTISQIFIESSETEIIANASHFLRISSLFYPVLGVLFLVRNSLQGLGYSLLPMSAGVCELIARAVISFGFVSIYGFNAVCFASPAAWLCADILLVTAYVICIKKLQKQYSNR